MTVSWCSGAAPTKQRPSATTKNMQINPKGVTSLQYTHTSALRYTTVYLSSLQLGNPAGQNVHLEAGEKMDNLYLTWLGYTTASLIAQWLNQAHHKSLLLG